MSKSEMIAQELEKLITQCPDMAKKEGIDHDLTQEAGAIWCGNVAKWTEELLKQKKYGSKIKEMMNWYIEALQPGKPARKAYDALLNMLLDGYKLIIDPAYEDVMIPANIFDWDIDIPMKATQWAERAIGLIELQFGNPWNGNSLDALHYPYSVKLDPIIVSNVNNLHEARLCLERHQRGVGIPLEARISELLLETEGNDQIEIWLYTIEELYKHIQPPAKMKPEPWIWLGINLLGFRTPRRYDVFRSLPEVTQKSIGNHVNSISGVQGDFIQVVRNTLEVVRQILKEYREAEQKLANEKKTKQPKTKFKPWESHGDARFVIDKQRINFYYDGTIKDLRLKNFSQTQELLLCLVKGSLQPSEIKGKISPDTQVTAAKIVEYANRLLNIKIRKVGFTCLPDFDVEFIKRDKYNHYFFAVPLQTKEDFDKWQNTPPYERKDIIR